MILRNRLKERRAALGVNQQEMGKLCGVSRQTISLIERGDYSPSVTLALTIAKVCGVTVEEVFSPPLSIPEALRKNWGEIGYFP